MRGVAEPSHRILYQATSLGNAWPEVDENEQSRVHSNMCTSIDEVQPEKGMIGARPRFVSLCMERRNNNGVHVFGFHMVINGLVGQKTEVEIVVTSTKHGYEPVGDPTM